MNDFLYNAQLYYEWLFVQCSVVLWTAVCTIKLYYERLLVILLIILLYIDSINLNKATNDIYVSLCEQFFFNVTEYYYY